MSTWSRLKRTLRAMFGGLIEKTEDPELVLQQTIRDMRDRVPELNNSVAQVMATERLLAKNKDKLAQQVVDLDSKIKASIKMGRDDIATAYIGQLQQAQLDLQRTDQQLQHATLASKQALKARDNYVMQMQRRSAEAKMQLGSASVDAQMQDIEREALDMQLQDKLLEYKQSMGLLPGASSSTPGQLPAAGGSADNERPS